MTFKIILPKYCNSLLLFCLACALLIGGCTSTPQTTKPTTPNIIYILADDLGYGDLSITGQKYFQTPNIDQLAKEGMLFTQHYAGSTVCAPSRAALLTGMHTGHTPIRGNRAQQPEGQMPLPSGITTIAELLQQKGYVTGAFGKWGLGFPGSEGDPNNQGFDQFFGYNCQRLAHNYYPYYLWDNQMQVTLPGNANDGHQVYAPQLIHDKALAFMDANKDTTFFLYYPSIIPHAELVAPESYMKLYRDQLPPEKVFRAEDTTQIVYEKNGKYSPQKEAHAAFAAMIHLLDEQVGQIREKVEQLGIADRTLIIFTSDNGPHVEGGADPTYFNSNGPWRGHKRDLYEGGIRVPMIASWPSTIPPNTQSNHVSAFWDLVPTLCELVQLAPPENTDGISFLPTLKGDTSAQVVHDFLYWEFHGKQTKQAVRMAQWKGIRNQTSTEMEVGKLKLYDLMADPQERTNIALAHPEVVEALEQIMNRAHSPSLEFPLPFERAN